MIPHVAIATRNNPSGLACLLGSICRFRLSVSIADASDVPVITDQQIARISANISGGVHYTHTTSPNLVAQRRCAVDFLRDEDWSLFLDDDLAYVGEEDLAKVISDSSSYGYDFIQGYKVDAFNDRGYPDFGRDDLTPHHDPGYARRAGYVDEEGIVAVQDCAPFRYDGGVFLTTKGALESAYNILEEKSCRVGHPPHCIQDDSLVQLLGSTGNTAVGVSFHFRHYGNDNSNWSTNAQKQYAVDQLTRKGKA
ncbi:MAG: hypothetical protein GF334_13425 [Candidatus Altiarchaeales archaeon]|nr:hypothetical protein [Candidatus Altiarchaeales archaeon]